MRHAPWLQKYWVSLSSVGLIVAALFFAASLSPSLLPRHYIFQGLLSGFALSSGYAIGVLAAWVWVYLDFPKLSDRGKRALNILCFVVAVSVVGFFLVSTAIWQNSIRELMEMEPLTSAYPLRISFIAMALMICIIGIVRFFRKSYQSLARILVKYIPQRISNIVGFIVVSALVIMLVEGVLLKNALSAADNIFAQLDELIEDGVEKPVDQSITGSITSLIPWNTIGRRGKEFMVSGPTKQSITQFLERDAKNPIRVYVGLRSEQTVEERANLALQELVRVGGFEKKILVIATPTGTGWLDPGAVDTLEYIHGGDTAIVTLQYSYLPSWLTLLVDPDLVTISARILFRKIYDHWKKLPKENRPKLYLHGLSLGAFGSENSTQLHLVLDDLFQGAVWSGPPFPSKVWSAATLGREKGSPTWLPQYSNGTIIRFTGRKNTLRSSNAAWGPMRIVYIQHASDPMTFFSPDILFKSPDWLKGDRAKDVSRYFKWYPIITFLQIAFDLPMATSVPAGYGHNIAPSSYIDAWVEVTNPKNWDADNTKQLKRLFSS